MQAYEPLLTQRIPIVQLLDREIRKLHASLLNATSPKMARGIRAEIARLSELRASYILPTPPDAA